MDQENSYLSATCEARLGARHFAHLRAVAEGVPVQAAARRFLGMAEAAAALSAHCAVVQWAQARARQAGDPRWRLIGMVVRDTESAAHPPLAQWVAEQGLEAWSEAEVLALYAQAFPEQRGHRRGNRLRRQQLDALRELEQSTGSRPQGTDPLAGWFEPGMARRFEAAALSSLSDLQLRIAQGGLWWRGIPGVGRIKAGRIAAYMGQLLPDPAHAGRGGASPSLQRDAAPSRELQFTDLPAWPAGANRASSSPCGIGAATDEEALESWLRSRPRSTATARAYRREGERLRLWAALERGKSLSALTPEDCLAYAAFLEDIPGRWISRRRAARSTPDWAPFGGQLSESSRRQALVILGNCFNGLVADGYLLANPFEPVRRPRTRLWPAPGVDSRALSPRRWEALLQWTDAQRPSPARDRFRFLLCFTEATGLRAGELLVARLGDLEQLGDAWTLQVAPGSRRSRRVALDSTAVQVLEGYLAQRGLPPLGQADGHLPLLSALGQAATAIGYRSLYATMRSWLSRGLGAVENLDTSCAAPVGASLHWLRHGCGIRALRQGMAPQRVQSQLGHADARTTRRYARVRHGPRA